MCGEYMNLKFQYSFVLNAKISSYEDCPCLGAEGECEILSIRDVVFCACIGDDGETIADVCEGHCPMKVKSKCYG